MGLTERHWFENEDVPENCEWDLEDAVYNSRINKTHDNDIVRCKDCIYFVIKDFWGEFNGIPVLGTSNQPTCTKWGDGDCKTSPDGYCFLARRR